jgi:uncharacterized membrane protein (DUF485 family)
MTAPGVVAREPEARAGEWEAIERTAEFRELVAARRRFVVPALAVFVVWFGTFLVLWGYARGFMRKDVVGNVTVAYVLSVSLIALTWAVAWSYLRYSARTLTPLIERAARAAEEVER